VLLRFREKLLGTASIQADGKILIGGRFDSLDGQSRTNLARLNPDGSLDLSFNPSPDDFVNSLAVQPDGKILVGGDFRNLGGQPSSRIGRLNPDSTTDNTFSPVVFGFGHVYSLALQADGKILVGGDFDSSPYLLRLNPNGTLDSTFHLALDYAAIGPVRCLAVQKNERILVGGDFTRLGGLPHNFTARLNSDGTPDTNTTRVVTTLADSGSGSLRQAIADALPGDPITFATNGTITLTSGELLLPCNLAINASAAPGPVTIDAPHGSRIFYVASNAEKGFAHSLVRCVVGRRGDPEQSGRACRDRFE